MFLADAIDVEIDYCEGGPDESILEDVDNIMPPVGASGAKVVGYFDPAVSDAYGWSRGSRCYGLDSDGVSDGREVRVHHRQRARGRAWHGIVV